MFHRKHSDRLSSKQNSRVFRTSSKLAYLNGFHRNRSEPSRPAVRLTGSDALSAWLKRKERYLHSNWKSFRFRIIWHAKTIWQNSNRHSFTVLSHFAVIEILLTPVRAVCFFRPGNMWARRGSRTHYEIGDDPNKIISPNNQNGVLSQNNRSILSKMFKEKIYLRFIEAKMI